MKIHIIGGSGTGKSYIAQKISKKYSIPHYDSDDIFWDNNADSYGIKMPEGTRTLKLAEILKQENWIIEGVYHEWLKDSFACADRIFILITPAFVFNYRIIRRFFKRKIGIEKGKKETLRSLKDLLIWTNNYHKNRIPVIKEFLKQYKEKVVVLTNASDIYKYI